MSDAVPLTTRVGALGALRGLFVAAVLAACWMGPSVAGQRTGLLVALSVAYAVLAAGLEGLRRHAGWLPRALVGCSLLADALYLVAAATLTGGPGGPLGFLVPVHLIAVTLLASYRTGLKLVLWDSLLLAVAYSAQRAGLIDVPAPSRQAAVIAITAFWLIALVTAACSALNERELRRGRAGYGALARMAAEVQRVDSPSAVAPMLLRGVEQHTGYPRAAVLLAAGGAGEGRFECWTTADPEGAVVASSAEPGGVIRRCWERGEPALTRELDPDRDAPLATALPGARNVVVLPLVADDAPLGVLAVERAGSKRARISASGVALLAQFAAHATLAYVNARLQQQLQQLAALDGLTQLCNRRMFDEALDREVQRAQRSGQALALVMLDVDRFKQVNDRHGHLVGDEVLRGVASVIARHVRGSDVPARYGGEEFAVLLPACDTAGAARMAENLRAAVAEVTDPVTVTVSAGVASLPYDAGSDADLLQAADAALYRAKAAGRNRVVCATERAVAPT